LKFSKRERRVVIIGIVVAFIISFKLIGSSLTVKGTEIKESIGMKSILLERYRLVAAQKEQAAIELVALREKLKDAEGRLLKGDTPALASVELQTIMEETARKRGVGIKRVNTLKPEENGDYHKVFVEITFSSDIASLVYFLYDIEYNLKALSISELNTKRHTRKEEREALQTTLKVMGKLKRGGKEAATRSKAIGPKGFMAEGSI
jgi:hypothetical protein